MKILGAGFPRTGTLSTRGALTDLGLDPCIHGDSFVNFSTCQLIKEFYRGNHGPFIDFLKSHNYQATLDFPTIALVDELMPYFPEAKILLNVRDSSKVWLKSFRATVFETIKLRHWFFGAGQINYYFSGLDAAVLFSDEFYSLWELFFQRLIGKFSDIVRLSVVLYRNDSTKISNKKI